MKLIATLLRRTAPLTGALLIASTPLLAQDAGGTASPTEAAAVALPAAADVMEAYVEATGGRAAHERIETRVMQGTLAMDPMGIEGSVRSVWARPGRSYARVELGMGFQEQGTSGQHAWENGMGGARLLEGNELAARLRASAFDHLVDWKTLYKSVEVVGRENADGRTLLRVVMTPPEEGGHPEVAYFDEETHMLVKEVRTVKSPMGEIEVTLAPQEYRELDGVKVPTKMVQSAGGQTIVIRFQKIEQNVELEPGTFDPPAAIPALIAEQAESEPSAR